MNKTNKFPGTCKECGGPVHVGKGVCSREWDNYKSEQVWVVTHIDRDICNNWIEEKNNAKMIKNDYAEKTNMLISILKSDKNLTPSTRTTPKGNNINIDRKTSIVVDDDYAWLLMENNSSISWKESNVSIYEGYRVELQKVENLVNDVIKLSAKVKDINPMLLG